MRSLWLKVWLLLLVGLVGLGTLAGGTDAVAQAPAVTPAGSTPAAGPASDRLAALEKLTADQQAAIAQAQTSGDNAWMLVSAALVLMMSGPWLALFYGG